MDQSATRRTVLVKIGSGVLAPEGSLDRGVLDLVCAEVARLRGRGDRVVLVSSGAVACGAGVLGIPGGIAGGAMDLRTSQAAAAIGQPTLVHAYRESLAPHGIVMAQVLLTADDIRDRTRYLNARATLGALLEAGVVPIVNENDSVLFDEIRVGDNDTLAALVGSALRVDHAVLVSVAGGLRDLVRREVIEHVGRVGDALAHVEDGRSASGTGGMASKLDAVAILLGSGVPVSIVPGPSDDCPDPVTRALDGGRVGTRFTRADLDAIPGARKAWILHGAPVRGRLVVDEGAARALTERGASLLPKGVVGVEGDFAHEAGVEIRPERGGAIARGLASYGAREIERIMGRGSGEIEGILGYAHRAEVVHRDHMALLRKDGA